MRTLVVTALVALVCLAGCAASGSSGATDPPTGSTGSTGPSVTTAPPTASGPSDPPSDETCPYLTAEQVSATLGKPMVETAGSTHACFFDPEGAEEPGPGDGPTVMLSRVGIEIDPADYAAQTRALCLGDVTDVDLGDEAFACVMGFGPQGQLYVGRVLITVNVNGAVDDATGIDLAVALLRDVKVPKPS